MNKRIKELIKQATTIRYSGPGEIEEFDKELFAELLVRECIEGFEERISTRYQGSEKDNNIAYGMEIVVEHIKQHFGVEE
jgi:hypothetical protein